jgi:hypothetical protein
MNNSNFQAIKHWVKESTKSSRVNKNTKTIEERIQSILDRLPPLTEEQIVYRGHQSHSRTIVPSSWFSTSSDLEKVHSQHISENADCCLFKIHVLPGIRCFSIYDFMKASGKNATGYDEESEIIVNGGGVFYANKELTTPGFAPPYKSKDIDMFETWYAPAPLQPVGGAGGPSELRANRLFDRIPEDEYNFITSINNLKSMIGPQKNEIISNTTYANVWDRIAALKKGGKQRKTRRRRRSYKN